MSRIYRSVDALIGNTPLLELTRIQREEKLKPGETGISEPGRLRQG